MGLAVLEKQYLEELMANTQGDMREACRIAGLSRSRLYGLMKKHEIPRVPFSKTPGQS